MKKFPFFLLILFHVHLLGAKNTANAFSNFTDRDTLLSFKQKISDPQNSLSSWNQTSSHCSWLGVSCFANETRVMSLRLPELGLSGVLPPLISSLTSLFHLDLSNNTFYGQLPLQLGQLSRLREVALPGNSFTGEIPTHLSKLRHVRVLRLSANKFFGRLPPELGLLDKLQVLDLSSNNLAGEIPSTFGNLSSLLVLELARNQLEGEIPHELGRIPNLTHLQLQENSLTGKIPPSLYNLSSLTFLSLMQNHFDGNLPEDLGLALPNLEQLLLSTNMLEGQIPESISNASKIQVLRLTNNSFRGPIPILRSMSELKVVDFGSNELSSTTDRNAEFFGSLTDSKKLESLYLFANKLSGNLPSSVANLSVHLEELCVYHNLFTGEIPQGFERFRDLFSLSLEVNSFSGKIPKSIGVLKNLVNFAADHNKLSGEIPDFFHNLTGLNYLLLGHNQLSGAIPRSIGQCQQLLFLELSANRLNGSIPAEILQLSKLTSLRLSENGFRGSLPSQVGNLDMIQIIDVSSNQLSGNLSHSIGSFPNLRSLIMARNKIMGPIPESIGKLASLENLDLSFNSLSGTIPEVLGDLKYLLNLNLSFNHLGGAVPARGVFLKISNVSLHGNDKLCGRDKEIAAELGLLHCVKSRKRHFLLTIAILVPSITLLVTVLFFLWAMFFHKRKRNSDNEASSFDPSMVMPPMISYLDIRIATDDFSIENLIGSGGFGKVYKGVSGKSSSQTPTIFAVKVIDMQKSKASKTFNAECETLRNVRHRNLVKVITSCSSIDHKGGEFKALVMEFMPNGNLDMWLYPQATNSGSFLRLEQRLEIAIGVASAMDYLHHDCFPPIVHCDLKPENVLLDDGMAAHVADFGLARFISQNSHDESETIGLRGSIGYIAPEYGFGSKVTTRGDVYSFGILLLELFIAKKPTNEMFKEGLSLNKFASAVNDKKVLQIADPMLFGFRDNTSSTQSGISSNSSERESSHSSDHRSQFSYRSEECVAAALQVGLSCAAHAPQDRLTMREALTKLHEIKKSLQGLL